VTVDRLASCLEMRSFIKKQKSKAEQSANFKKCAQLLISCARKDVHVESTDVQ